MKRLNVGGALVLVAAVGLAVPVMAQDTQPPADQRQPRQPRPKPTAPPANTTPAAPTTPAPGTPGAAKTPAKPPVPAVSKPITEPGPYIEQGKVRDWVLNVDVDVKSEQSSDWISPDGGKTRMPYIGQFDFATLAMVFMLPPQTGGARPDPSSVVGKMKIDDRITSDKAVVVDRQVSGQLYHSGVQLVRLNSETPAICREIEIEFDVKMTCWETKFDDAKAKDVPWPTGPWPEAAQATFGPQIYVTYERTRDKNGQPVTGEYDAAFLKHLADDWTGGNPKSTTPVMLAKFFAGKVASMVQPSGQNLKFLNTGQLQGFGLQGPVATLKNGRGSEFDTSVALVAMYRAAGLPARLVIGYEKEEAKDRTGSELIREGRQKKEGLRSWVEFCLYDEQNATVNWVPVDVVAMRKKTGGRAPALDKPWPYFGTNDDLDHILPLGFGFHPPTTVESYGAPALWGWLMTPAAPTTAYQAVRFNASSASVTSSDKDKKKSGNKK